MGKHDLDAIESVGADFARASTEPPPPPPPPGAGCAASPEGPQWAAQGAQLQAWLDSIGRTHQWLADLLETSRAAVTQWVAGTQRPNLQHAAALGVAGVLEGPAPPQAWEWQTPEEQEQAAKYAYSLLSALAL